MNDPAVDSIRGIFITGRNRFRPILMLAGMFWAASGMRVGAEEETKSGPWDEFLQFPPGSVDLKGPGTQEIVAKIYAAEINRFKARLEGEKNPATAVKLWRQLSKLPIEDAEKRVVSTTVVKLMSEGLPERERINRFEWDYVDVLAESGNPEDAYTAACQLAMEGKIGMRSFPVVLKVVNLLTSRPEDGWIWETGRSEWTKCATEYFKRLDRDFLGKLDRAEYYYNKADLYSQIYIGEMSIKARDDDDKAVMKIFEDRAASKGIISNLERACALRPDNKEWQREFAYWNFIREMMIFKEAAGIEGPALSVSQKAAPGEKVDIVKKIQVFVESLAKLDHTTGGEAVFERTEFELGLYFLGQRIAAPGEKEEVKKDFAEKIKDAAKKFPPFFKYRFVLLMDEEKVDYESCAKWLEDFRNYPERLGDPDLVSMALAIYKKTGNEKEFWLLAEEGGEVHSRLPAFQRFIAVGLARKGSIRDAGHLLEDGIRELDFKDDADRSRHWGYLALFRAMEGRTESAQRAMTLSKILGDGPVWRQKLDEKIGPWKDSRISKDPFYIQWCAFETRWNPLFDAEKVPGRYDLFFEEIKFQLEGLEKPSEKMKRMLSLFKNGFGFSYAELFREPAASSLSHVLLERKGNCVGLSGLILLYSKELGLPTRLKKMPSHVFLEQLNEGSWVRVESTNFQYDVPGEFYQKRNGKTESDIQDCSDDELWSMVLSNLAIIDYCNGNRKQALEKLGGVQGAKLEDAEFFKQKFVIKHLPENPSNQFFAQDGRLRFVIDDPFSRKGRGFGFANPEEGERFCSDLEDFLRLQPEDGDFWYLLGQACYAKGDNLRAEEAMEKACRLNPPFLKEWSIRALKCVQGKKWAEAQKICESVLKQKNDYPAALAVLGLCQVNEDRLDKKTLETAMNGLRKNPADQVFRMVAFMHLFQMLDGNMEDFEAFLLNLAIFWPEKWGEMKAILKAGRDSEDERIVKKADVLSEMVDRVDLKALKQYAY